MPEKEKQLTTVATAVTEIKQSQDLILKDVLQLLNLTGQLDAVNDFWKDLKSQVGGIENNLGNLVNTVETQVPEMSRYVAIGLYTIGSLFVLMTVIALLVHVRLLFRGFKLRFYLLTQIDGTLSPFKFARIYPLLFVLCFR